MLIWRVMTTVNLSSCFFAKPFGKVRAKPQRQGMQIILFTLASQWWSRWKHHCFNPLAQFEMFLQTWTEEVEAYVSTAAPWRTFPTSNTVGPKHCLESAYQSVKFSGIQLAWESVKILRMTSVPDSGSPVLVLARLGKSLECISWEASSVGRDLQSFLLLFETKCVPWE